MGSVLGGKSSGLQEMSFVEILSNVADIIGRE